MGKQIGHVKVTKFHYKLRGYCQSSIVEASDGLLYVLKIAGSHVPNLVFNEAFGTELFRSFGLPTAEWIPLQLDDEFIQSNPEMWFKTGHHGCRPVSGFHFGSRLVSPKRGVGAYQIIPSSWVPKVKNRNQFIGALAVDIWANHCDRRQAIYTRSGEHLKATFIDNGHMFGGLEGAEMTCPRRCVNSDFAVYRDLHIHQSLERWRKRIIAADLTAIRMLAEELPPVWYTPSLLDRTIESLRVRRQKLGSLFRETTTIVSHPHALNSREFVNSLDPHITLATESVHA